MPPTIAAAMPMTTSQDEKLEKRFEPPNKLSKKPPKLSGSPPPDVDET
jgi:hypothetical protein